MTHKEMALKEDLIPNKLDLLLYVILAVVIIFFGNFSYFTNQLFGMTAGTHESLGTMFRVFVGDLVMFLDGLSFTATTAVFAFWSLTGIIVFSFLQSVYGVYIEIKNDIRVSTNFLHPGNYSNAHFWLGVLLQFVTHSTIYLLVVVWLLMLTFVLIPVALTAAIAFFSDMSLVDGVTLVSAFILLTFGISVLGQSLRLLFRHKTTVS